VCSARQEVAATQASGRVLRVAGQSSRRGRSIRARVKGERLRLLSIVGRRYAASRAAARSGRTTESRLRKIGLDFLGSVGRRLNSLAEFDRIRDVGDWIHRRAGAGHDDGSVAEQAPADRLLDANAFHLGQIQLDRAAFDEAEFRDYAAIGDGELGGIAAN